ncbi:MAG: T9SS type A sorting domain-containing protein [Massilibacteroides sp.]|nr:T9SS type A sorting domain-containing protein [Massilibacteroides sp.]MDD3062405.1 T9SS type A sorting domain-containing protein [Massilibacteroides sp.]MDD4115928.1 T9SS type A sorting domain-containing protein [Massilibacteroides sp.]MDD4660705.1 T9SS type A sorting domain-containing protein [Massilibacteroides sp.]
MKIFSYITLYVVLTAGISGDLYAISRYEILYSTQQKREAAEVEISIIDNRLKIKNALVGSKLEIYSIVGVKVFETEIKYSSGEYVLNLAKGYYIVRLKDTVRKIVIR